MIRTFVLLVYISLETVAVLLILIFTGLCNPYSKFRDKLFRFWSHPILFIAGVKMDITGLENYDPNKGYIVCSNHSHLFDIPVLCIASRLNIKFAAKKELFNIPIFGQVLHFAGMVKIDRKNTKNALKRLNEIEDVIEKEKIALVLFPEGTRNRTNGKMLPFKKGAFMLALNTKQAILPVTINGTNKILNGIITKPRRISIHFHEPIPSTDYNQKTRKEFMELTKKIIESKLDYEAQ